MKVLKFGGTSVGCIDAIRQVKEIIIADHEPLIVVVSAVGKTTDQLHEIARLASNGDKSYENLIDSLRDEHIQLATELQCNSCVEALNAVFEQLKQVCEGVYLLKELTPRSLDFILGSGETLSSLMIADFLSSSSKTVKRVDSREVIVTDDSFGEAKVNLKLTKDKLGEVEPTFKQINVFPGFIASTEAGEVTTLGRGGSDYTAALIAALLDTESLEIWTDVDGIMTADPRRVKRAHMLDGVSYEEALELSHFGAKVIYVKSIAPVLQAGIPVRIKNTFNPEGSGTLISADTEGDGLIKGISSIDEVTIMSIRGNASQNSEAFFSRLFKVLDDHKIQVVFITHSNAINAITLGFEAQEAKRALKVLKQEFRHQEERELLHPSILEEGYSLLAMIGSNMKDQIGVSGHMFSVLGNNGISIKAISQGSSERNISVIIPKHDLNKALNVLHESFFLSMMRRVNLFIIGVGNVGQAFLDQLTQQFSFLKNQHHLNLKVIGIANSRKMYFENDGLPLSKWKEQLEKGDSFSKEGFIHQMIDLNFRNSIFIDITASHEIAGLYKKVLSESISVVTPNKIAATRSQEEYHNLKMAARKYRSNFLIETNVCAGLPILSTLNDLVRSGDQVHRIEAVLSGTLNFLFNEYDGKSSFKSVIQKAKELGYTEPDPRLDISGEDVMRKLLILVRESGYQMEAEEIEITSFLPSSCENSKELDDFYAKIENEESYFKSMYEKSEKNGTKLKVVATYEKGKGKVSLEEVQSRHPFYHLEGKDNVVLFYTNRYKEQPLVIKGAGAGAEVTASGIFADVLRVAQSDS